MRSFFASTLVGVLSLFSLADASHAPKKPGLTYLYTVNITGGTPYDVGPGPYGDRVVVPIVSGTFSGPKMSGELTFPLIIPLFSLLPSLYLPLNIYIHMCVCVCVP